MISILLGSGFSIDEGIPGVAMINKRLSKLRADQIFLGSDQSARFLLDGESDPNGWFPQNLLDRTFAQDIIGFYNDNVLKDGEEFNYEIFFDYFYLPYRKNAFPNELKSFLGEWREKNVKKVDHMLYDDVNLIGRFHRIFSQLVAHQLIVPKYCNEVTLLNYPKYGHFIEFVAQACKSQKTMIHTLNHDQFFDYLGRSHQDLCEYYCDGYAELGSPYYGIISIGNGNDRRTYRVRLRFFNAVYDKELCFFKLHGCINTKIYNIAGPAPDLTRIKAGSEIIEILKEVADPKTNEIIYDQGFQENYPDYLSGTTNKILSYDDPHYKILFDHFKSNLKTSDKLIVIGYGFKDSGINKMIEELFLKRGGKMTIVDPYPNKIFPSIYDINYIVKRVTSVTPKEWNNI